MLLSNGEATPPCGVPRSLGKSFPCPYPRPQFFLILDDERGSVVRELCSTSSVKCLHRLPRLCGEASIASNLLARVQCPTRCRGYAAPYPAAKSSRTLRGRCRSQPGQ